MIDVNRIVSRAVRTLDLQTYPTCTELDQLAALSEVLIDLSLDLVGSVQTHAITTVAGQGEYELNESIAMIHQIHWPDGSGSTTAWMDEVKFVTPQYIRDLRQDLIDDSEIISGQQPTYYTYYRKANGKNVLVLESAATIEADLTITVEYYEVSGAELKAGDKINAPMSQFPVLRYGLCARLAEQFIPAREAEMLRKYEDAKAMWRMRATNPSTEMIHRPIQPF